MAETIFKNKISVHRWLIDNDWQISQTQFYDHCRDGLLRARKGVYSIKAVKKYASLHVKKAETGEKENERLSRQQEEDKQLDIDLKKIKKADAQWALDIKEKKYMLSSDHIRHMVAAASVLDAGLKHFFRLKSEEIIDLVEGDQKHSATLVRFCIAQLDMALTEFAKPREFEIEIERVD